MVFDRFSEDDVNKNNGALMYGRVRQYKHNDGYGFIHTESGKDIFVSSYNLGKKKEKRFFFGALVSFIPVIHDGKVIASEVNILNSFPSGSTFCMPNGESMLVKRICKYGYVSGKQVLEKINQTEEEMTEAGYSLKDLEYVFISTTIGEYKFYNVDAKQKGDGQTDLDALMDKLNKTFLSVY